VSVPWKLLVVGGAAVLLFGGGTAAYVYGGPSLRPGVDRDPKKLLPGFAKKLNVLFIRMRARGYQPMLWEGRRAAERAAALAQKGTGIVLSMHILGAAVDIVDGSTPDPWKASPGFWNALGEEARKLGLTWGGDWTSNKDVPHVQALAVNQQAAFRNMTPGQQASYVV
jgi:hypothetical protein